MKSEAWQELWQQQPAPTPVSDPQRVIDDARAAEREWERDWNQSENAFLVCALLVAGPELLRLVLTRHFEWFGLLLNITYWSWALAYVALRVRRRAQERNYRGSLIDHINRGKQVLRDQRTLHWLSLMMLPLASVMSAMMLWDATDGSIALTGLGSAATLLVMAVVWWMQGRAVRRRISIRASRLDQMRVDLIGSDPAGESGRE